jgi:hypothetical protein
MRSLALALAPFVLSACGFFLPPADEETGDEGGDPEDMFVAVGDQGALMSSPDGQTWTTRTSGVGSTLYDVTYAAEIDDGLFVAVGQAGKILTSVNGLDWSAASSPSSRDLRAVTWHFDRFYAVGGDYSAGAETLESIDGTTWTRPEVTAPLHLLTDLVSNGYSLVALGLYQSDLQTFGLFTWDATAGWIQRIDGSLTGARYDAVATGYPAFALVGASTSATSNDAVNWTPVPIFNAPPMHALVYSGLGWVAVGDGGGVLTSPDALTWTTRATPATVPLRGVTTNGGIYVAVGDGGTLLSSADGATWTALASPLDFNIQAVTHPRE